jgi:hypothetical protein
MKRRHVYDPVGKCIYCGDDSNPGRLTIEHIIPESLGGTLELPDASCHDCQVITGAFEGHNAGKLFRPIRRQFKMPSKRRGRKQKEERTKETFLVVIDGIKRHVSTEEYPGLLISFAFPFPTILLGIPPEHRDFAGGVSIGVLPEFGERLNALRAKYGNEVKFLTPGSAEAIGRLLAKIAHAYAVAELGYGSFQPYLLGIIRNQDPLLMHHLIGSAIGKAPVSDDLHEIDILQPDQLNSGKLVVVKIHLFSNYDGMAVHYVVAGERT